MSLGWYCETQRPRELHASRMFAFALLLLIAACNTLDASSSRAPRLVPSSNATRPNIIPATNPSPSSVPPIALTHFDAGTSPVPPMRSNIPVDAGDPNLPRPRLEPPGFCGRTHDDVSALFCGALPPPITSLADLSSELKLDQGLLLGHSTSLAGRFVSAINPRAILFSFAGSSSGLNAAAFTRGEQRVELISLDHTTKRLNFYLLEFTQDCNDSSAGCTPGDRLTPAIERDWRELRLHDDEELKDTPQDCRRCHGGSPNGRVATLLMRELGAPWLHWFSGQFSTLQKDYQAAKGTELYAGVRPGSDPALLQNEIGNVQRELKLPAQPLSFPSGTIQLETQEISRIPGKPGPGADDPELWPSPTWRLQFDAYRAGASLAPPYHHERITDAAKLATATAAYQDFLAGHIAKDALADISDVMPSDQRRLSEMALAVEPDASGGALLIQACAACHNAALDQTLSRAKFDADLSRVAGAELQEAASRLELPADDPRAMPPREGVRMSADQRKALVAYLRNTDPTKVKPWPAFEAPPTDYHLEQAAYIQFSNIDSDASELGIADLTNDGRMDIVGPPYLLVQRDDGAFANEAPLPASPLAYYVRALDVDADGRADLVSTPTRQPSDGTQAGLLTYLSSGAGAFSSGIASPGPNPTNLSTACVGDVDRDGHLDFVLFVIGTAPGIEAYLGDGYGAFHPSAVAMDDATNASFYSMALGDITHDGNDDLVLYDGHAPHAIVVYAHDGSSGFRHTGTRYPLPGSVSYAAGHVYLAVGDANADGRNDVVITSDSDGTRLLLQGSDGTLGSAPVIAGGTGAIMFSDMDRDGLQDLVSVGPYSDSVHVLLQGPRGLDYPRTLDFPFMGSSASVLDMSAVGDLNSDGCPDVVGAQVGSIVVMRGVGCAQ